VLTRVISHTKKIWNFVSADLNPCAWLLNICTVHVVHGIKYKGWNSEQCSLYSTSNTNIQQHSLHAAAYAICNACWAHFHFFQKERQDTHLLVVSWFRGELFVVNAWLWDAYEQVAVQKRYKIFTLPHVCAQIWKCPMGVTFNSELVLQWFYIQCSSMVVPYCWTLRLLNVPWPVGRKYHVHVCWFSNLLVISVICF
jgi:hypothetical protein